jgi:hypothetical protein
VLSLGFDAFLHGGLLAHLYAAPTPFLLGANDAFKRIPFGYSALLVLTAALYWFLSRLRISGAIAGCRCGAAAGAVVWGAFVVGLYSISTAGLPLLASWWIGQTAELGLAAAVLGGFLGGVPLKRIWGLVVVAVVAFLVATVLMQSLGLAPAMRMVE